MSTADAIRLFTQYLAQERHASFHTIQAYPTDLAQCASFLHVRGIDLVRASDRDLRSWIVSLSECGLNSCSINRKLAALKSFFKFLVFKHYVSENPAGPLRSLRATRNQPVFLKEQEILQLLWEYPFENDFAGWRAKIVLELLYGTGIRLSELLHLRYVDINRHGGTLRVLGKRQKQRIVPVPQPIFDTLDSYKAFRHTILLESNGNDARSPLIITASGKPAYPMLVYRIVRDHLRTATHSARYSPHVLRHTFATHLLLKGASLKAIQDLLGHASLSATQIYTHHTLKQLKETFTQAHPRS